MRYVEYIVKSVAVWLALWLALALVARIAISMNWISETDPLAFVVIAGSLLFSFLLTGFAVFARQRLALYSVLLIVGSLRFVSVLIVFLYPTYLAWKLHGFWGGAGAFCLPIISQIWAMYVNIKHGAWGYAMVLGVMIYSTFIYDWCKFPTPEEHNK